MSETKRMRCGFASTGLRDVITEEVSLVLAMPEKTDSFLPPTIPFFVTMAQKKADPQMEAWNILEYYITTYIISISQHFFPTYAFFFTYFSLWFPVSLWIFQPFVLDPNGIGPKPKPPSSIQQQIESSRFEAYPARWCFPIPGSSPWRWLLCSCLVGWLVGCFMVGQMRLLGFFVGQFHNSKWFVEIFSSFLALFFGGSSRVFPFSVDFLKFIHLFYRKIPAEGFLLRFCRECFFLEGPCEAVGCSMVN